MKQKIKKGLALILSAVLSAATLVTTIPQMSVPVYAAGTGKNLQLGTDALAPVMETVKDTYDVYQKSRVTTAQAVYYGSSGSKKWYVIGCNGTGAVQMGETVTLFAADNIDTGKRYSSALSDAYGTSDIKGVVDGYYSSMFSTIEQNVIKSRTLSHGDYSFNYDNFSDGISDASSVDANLWLLSTKEADLVGQSYRTANAFWWLRSPGYIGSSAACVGDGGDVNFDGAIVSSSGGVRPAFNLNLSSILFTSDAEGIKSPGAAGTLSQPGNHTTDGWKLTIIDDNLSALTSGTVTRSGDDVTVPYTASGTYDRISVFISDNSWNDRDAELKYYGRLDTSGGSGTGTFTLPSDYDSSWKVYIIAEKINGNTSTDYASTPVEITIKPALTITAEDITLEYNGQMQGPSDVVYGDPAEIAEVVTVEGLQAGDTLASIVVSGQGQEVGEYDLIPSQAKIKAENGDFVTDKYDITCVKGTLHIKNPHRHSYTGSVTKESTCTDAGIMTYRCSCGDSYTRSIPAPGHSYDAGVVTKEPSLVSEGVKTYTCGRCKHTYTEPIARLTPSQEDAEDIQKLLDDLTDEDGNLMVEVEKKTERKEDGSTITIIEIDGKEVQKTIVDENGEETVETNIWSLADEGEKYFYTGAAVKPRVHVYDGLKPLSVGSDYSVSYSNNINAGSKAAVTVCFKGGYQETKSQKVSFTIEPADLTSCASVSDTITAATGKLLKPAPDVTITDGGKSIKSQISFGYLNAAGEAVAGVKEPGEYTLIVSPKKGNKNLTGNAAAKITVLEDKNRLLSNAVVKLTKKGYTYTGDQIVPEKGSYSLTLNKEELIEGTDYEVADVRNNTAPGRATIIFKAVEGNEKGLTGQVASSFLIDKGRVLTEGEGSDFEYTYETFVPYAKGGAKPEVTVKDGDTVLVNGVDYTVSYARNKAVTVKEGTGDIEGQSPTDEQTAQIIVNGKGNYKGRVILYFAIRNQDISKLRTVVSDKVESRKGYKDPFVVITDLDGKKLAAKKDYVIGDDYSEPDEDGNVTVSVIGKGAYEGSSTRVSYRYIRADQRLSKVGAMPVAKKTFTGKAITLKRSELNKLLYKGNRKSPEYLVYGRDFEIVSYSGNMKTGTAKVTLKGIGDYGGTRVVSYRIVSKRADFIGMILKGLFE